MAGRRKQKGQGPSDPEENLPREAGASRDTNAAEASVTPWSDADGDSDSSGALLMKSKKRRQRKKKMPHTKPLPLGMVKCIYEELNSEPRDSDKTPERRDSGKTPEPRDSDKTPEPRDSDKTPEPRDSDKTPEPSDSDETPEPRESPVTPSPSSSEYSYFSADAAIPEPPASKTEMEPKPDISAFAEPLPFKFGVYAKEKNGQPIYSCQINTFLKPNDPIVFATTGGNRVSIYECDEYDNKGTDGRGLGIKLLKVFADPDDEEFYTCVWSITREGKPLLAAAGARSVIRIFSMTLDTCIRDILGHTGDINQLVVHPDDPNLLASASKDRSVRMWNISNGRCVAVFFGDGGHRDQVITVDIHREGKLMVTAGMDHSLIVWNLKSKEVVRSSLDSYNPKKRNSPAMVQVPIYSTRSVHWNYIDCAMWFGNFIFSKSLENEVICWKGGELERPWNSVRPNDDRVKIVTLKVEDCVIWFIRFGLDTSRKWLAVGNQEGKIYLFNVGVDDPDLIHSVVLCHKKCTTVIRQISFSRDGKILIAVCDDGTIWRWDLAE